MVMTTTSKYISKKERMRQCFESDIPEIGIDLAESKRNMGIATKSVKLLAKAAYKEKPVEYYLIRISSRNPHSKHVCEKMGVLPIGTSESTFKTFMNSFKSTIGDVDICGNVKGKFCITCQYYETCKNDDVLE